MNGYYVTLENGKSYGIVAMDFRDALATIRQWFGPNAEIESMFHEYTVDYVSDGAGRKIGKMRTRKDITE